MGVPFGGDEERFTHSLLLVLVNRILTFAVALSYLLVWHTASLRLTTCTRKCRCKYPSSHCLIEDAHVDCFRYKAMRSAIQRPRA